MEVLGQDQAVDLAVAALRLISMEQVRQLAVLVAQLMLLVEAELPEFKAPELVVAVDGVHLAETA
jgi:hypothetical protein